MTEIKLTLEGQTNPKWLANNLRSRARYMAEEVGASNTAAALREVARQIEKQAEPPVVAARDAYADQMNLELRQSIAANVLEAMDVDQYLIDAVRNATPDNGPMLSGEELRDASEKVDEWVRLDDAHAEGDAVEALVNKLGEDLFNNGITSLGDLKQRLRDLAIDARAVAS